MPPNIIIFLFLAAGESKKPVKQFNYNVTDVTSVFSFLFVYIVILGSGVEPGTFYLKEHVETALK